MLDLYFLECLSKVREMPDFWLKEFNEINSPHKSLGNRTPPELLGTGEFNPPAPLVSGIKMGGFAEAMHAIQNRPLPPHCC